MSKSDRVAPESLKPDPLKPRRGLFLVLCLTMAGWIAALVVMYFTTVRGRR